MRPKLPLLPRILVNIGLTFQFYIPGLIYLWFTVMGFREVFSAPPDARGTGLGFVVSFMLAILFLFPVLGLYLIYMFWDRFGKQINALKFLFVFNILLGFLWLGGWIMLFGGGIVYDPDVWLFSPAPLLLPTIFYGIALVANRSNRPSIQNENSNDKIMNDNNEQD